MVETFQQFENFLSSQKQFRSPESGSTYSSKRLESAFEDAFEGLKAGEVSPQEILKKFPRGKVRNNLIQVLETEWMDLANSKLGYSTQTNDDGEPVFRKYTSTGGRMLPYQGYKLRISADLNEGRGVAKAVLGYLRENDESHKVVYDADVMGGMWNGAQKGKFITIYPTVKPDNHESVRKGRQIFRKGKNCEDNKKSVNINLVEARELVNDLWNKLDSSIGLNGGPEVPTDRQVKNTRIYYRYGVINPVRGKYSDGSDITKDHLVGVDGEEVYDNRVEGTNNWEKLSGREPLFK